MASYLPIVFFLPIRSSKSPAIVKYPYPIFFVTECKSANNQMSINLFGKEYNRAEASELYPRAINRWISAYE